MPTRDKDATHGRPPPAAALIEARTFVVAPGIQDMTTAVIANKVGFDAVYGSGYWMTASAYGLPDAGIASYTQMLDRMATLVRTSTAPVIGRRRHRVRRAAQRPPHGARL